MKSDLKILVQFSGLAGVLGLAAIGCGGGGSSAGTTSMQPPVEKDYCVGFANDRYVEGTSFYTKCCVQPTGVDGEQTKPGPRINPSPEGCGEPPAVAGTVAAMQLASSNLTVASRGMEVAKSMGGDKAVMRNGESAATAVESNGASGGANGGNLPGLDHVTTVGSAKQDGAGGSGGGGGGSLGGGSGSGGFIGGANISTQEAIKTAEAQLAGQDVSMGAYGAGGGAGGAGRPKGTSEYSSLQGGLQGGKADSAAFDQSGRSLSSSGSDDPADYFSRLKSGDDIFKVVERRYGLKTRDWALKDSRETLKKVVGKLK